MSIKKCQHSEKSIGDRLKAYRKANGFNLVGFSELLSISHGALSGLENDKSKPSSDTLINICKNTDINIVWLLTGEGEMTRRPETEKEPQPPDQPPLYKVGVLDEDPKVADLLEAAARVLKSGKQVAFDALERNIRYFDHAIKTENRLNAMESRLADLEQHRDLPDEIRVKDPLEQKEALMKKRVI